MKFRDSRHITFVKLTGLYLLSRETSSQTPPVIRGQYVKVDEMYKANLNEKYTLVLHCILRFEGTSHKSFQEKAFYLLLFYISF